MLKELMERDGLDPHAVIIKVTEKLIDQYGRNTLDKYHYSGDKLISFLRRENKNYNTLIDEYYHLYGFAY